MLINKTVEMPDGTLTFQGELKAEELDMVIMYGLNTLMALGGLKPTIVNEDGNEEEQMELDLEEPSNGDTLQ